MMLRQYAHDWRGLRPAEVRLERIGGDPRPGPATLAKIEEGLRRTVEFAVKAPPFWADISDYWAGSVVNRFVPQLQVDDKTDIAAPTGHHFSCGWFKLARGEGLIATLPDAEVVPFWSLGVANYWYETIGLRDADCEINNKKRTPQFRWVRSRADRRCSAFCRCESAGAQLDRYARARGGDADLPLVALARSRPADRDIAREAGRSFGGVG